LHFFAIAQRGKRQVMRVGELHDGEISAWIGHDFLGLERAAVVQVDGNFPASFDDMVIG